MIENPIEASSSTGISNFKQIPQNNWRIFLPFFEEGGRYWTWNQAYQNYTRRNVPIITENVLSVTRIHNTSPRVCYICKTKRGFEKGEKKTTISARSSCIPLATGVGVYLIRVRSVLVIRYHMVMNFLIRVWWFWNDDDDDGGGGYTRLNVVGNL